MKNYEIKFESSKYENTIANYHLVVEAWNKHSETITKLGYKASLDDIYRVSNRHFQGAFITDATNQEVSKIAEFFGYKANELTIGLLYTSGELIRQSINRIYAKLHPLCHDINGLQYTCLFSDFLWTDSGAFEMVDNKIIVKDNANELIKEYYTTYTANEKQNKLYEALKEMDAPLNKLSKLINKYGITSFKAIISDYTKNEYKPNYEALEHIQ